MNYNFAKVSSEERNHLCHVTALIAKYLEDTDNEVRVGVVEDRMKEFCE